MEYLGQEIPKRVYLDGYKIKERKAYILCTAEEPEEQMQCIYYRAATETERKTMCHTAPEFSCFYCWAGCSDVCSFKKIEK